MKPIQSLKNCKNEIFLSFDDGPCPLMTPRVLDVLDSCNAKASFFVVGNKARKHPLLIKEVLKRGHVLGDHSMDHAYSHFFRGPTHIKNWVEQSQKNLKNEFGAQPIGFRSPAGVRTPPLKRALLELDIPWIHWKHRFYDTQFVFSVNRFSKKLDQIKAGDIILLHDQQKDQFQKIFLKSLTQFIEELKDKGFDFRPLTVEKFDHANS